MLCRWRCVLRTRLWFASWWISMTAFRNWSRSVQKPQKKKKRWSQTGTQGVRAETAACPPSLEKCVFILLSAPLPHVWAPFLSAICPNGPLADAVLCPEIKSGLSPDQSCACLIHHVCTLGWIGVLWLKVCFCVKTHLYHKMNFIKLWKMYDKV